MTAVEIGGGIVKLQLSAMILDDLLDDREAKAVAFFAHRHVGLEDAVAILGRQALAVVDNVYDELRGAFIQSRADHDLLLVTNGICRQGLDRLDGILDDVAEGLPSMRLSNMPSKASSPKSG